MSILHHGFREALLKITEQTTKSFKKNPVGSTCGLIVGGVIVTAATPFVAPLGATVTTVATALGASSAAATTLAGGLGVTAAAGTLMVGTHAGGMGEDKLKNHKK